MGKATDLHKPNNEDDDELDNAIIECKQKLEEKGYDKRGLMAIQNPSFTR